MATMIPSLDQIKVIMNINSGNAEFDALLIELGVVATKLIETFTRRTFVSASVVDVFDSKDNRTSFASPYAMGDSGLSFKAHPATIRLSRYPIDTDEAYTVHYSPNRLYAASDLLIQDTDYLLDAASGKVRLLVPTRGYPNAVRVAYTGGYVATSVVGDNPHDHMGSTAPEDLRMAVIAQIASMFDTSRSGSFGVVQQTGDDDGGTKTSSAFLIPEARELAVPYRRVLVGRT